MRILLLLIIFLAAVFVGFEIINSPGYALFVYQDWMVQMPLWLAVLFLFLLLAIVHFVTRFFYHVVFLKKSLRLWRLERRFSQKTDKK